MGHHSGEETDETAKLSATYRTWRYFVWVLALLLVIVGFYAEENWRGRRDLDAYKQKMVERGQLLTPTAFVPKPVPDSENFAQTPLLAPLYDFLPGTQTERDTNAVRKAQDISPFFDEVRRAMKEPDLPRSNSWVRPSANLIAWHKAILEAKEKAIAKTNSAVRRARMTEQTESNTRSEGPETPVDKAAAEILAAFSESNPIIEQLRRDSRRPFSRFNLRYEEENPAGILLPHLAILKNVTEILHLRAQAELVLDKGNDAFDDLTLMLYVTDSSKQEPILISQLVRIAQMQLALEAISYGMNKWSEKQFAELQVSLEKINFCADLKRALEGERMLLGQGSIDYIRRHPDKFNAFAPEGINVPEVLFRGMPGGWFDFEKLNYFRLFDLCFAKVEEDLDNRRINPDDVAQADKELQTILTKPKNSLLLKHRLFAQMLLPSLTAAVRKTGFAQEGVDVALLSCALERYHRKHKEFPERLDSLVPEFAKKVPADIINGQPLHYSRPRGDQYILYSVGWNEKDDGGTVQTAKKEKGRVPIEGDWVWR